MGRSHRGDDDWLDDNHNVRRSRVLEHCHSVVAELLERTRGGRGGQQVAGERDSYHFPRVVN